MHHLSGTVLPLFEYYTIAFMYIYYGQYDWWSLSIFQYEKKNKTIPACLSWQLFSGIFFFISPDIIFFFISRCALHERGGWKMYRQSAAACTESYYIRIDCTRECNQKFPLLHPLLIRYSLFFFFFCSFNTNIYIYTKNYTVVYGSIFDFISIVLFFLFLLLYPNTYTVFRSCFNGTSATYKRLFFFFYY